MANSALHSSHHLPRYAIGGGFVLLLVWLALSPPPTAAKWVAITKEMERGTIGKLPPAETQLLQQTLAWLLPQAGIMGPVVINGRPQQGALHVYTTTPAALSVTGCARGNALYDAQLDIVFIDEHILHPEEITHLGEDSPGPKVTLQELTFIPIYLRFILLHELGHRQLHRQSGGAFFDVGNGTRTAEKEADDFAVAKLKKAYAADFSAGGQRVGKGAAQFIQLDLAGLTNAERVWADLVGAVSTMSLDLMFSASDFSSFYEDTAHPNFIKRASAILDEALAAPEPSAALKAHAAIYQRYLHRMQSLAQSRFAELQLPAGVQRVTFDSGRLLALTNHGDLFAAPLTEITQVLTQPEHSPLQLTQALVKGNHRKGAVDNAFMSKMWAHPATGMVLLQPKGNPGRMSAITIRDTNATALLGLQRALQYNGGEAALFPPAKPWYKGGTAYDTDLFVPPQPAQTAIMRIAAGQNGTDLLLIREGQLSGRVSLDTLAVQIGTRLKISSVAITVGTVTDSIAYLTVFQRSGTHDQLVGVAELDQLTGRVGRVTTFRSVGEGGGEMFTIPNDKLVVVPGHTQPRYVLLTRNRIHFLAFSLSPMRPAKLLTEQGFLFDSVLTQQNINGDVLGNFDPILTDARFVYPGYVLATFSNDSIYLLDVRTGQTTTLFSPGNFVKAAISNQGHIAFFVHNGRKIYVIHPSSTRQPFTPNFMNQITRPWLLTGIFVALLCMGFSWWLLVRNPVRFGAVAVSASSGAWRLAFGYTMTVFGVIFGTAYRNLQSRRDKGEPTIPGIVPFLRSVFLSVDFWLGICGSPLVYALIVQATEGGSVAGLTVMAIQNGFFCTVVIAGLNPTNGLIPAPGTAGAAATPAEH